MAARAQYGKQRQALPSTDGSFGSKNRRKNHTKRPNSRQNADRTVEAVKFHSDRSDFGRKTGERNGLTKAHGTLPKAQPPSRAPS